MTRSTPPALLVLALLTLGQVAEASSSVPAAGPRFSGLERLYFERLEDPAEAVSGLRGAGALTPLDEEMRRLLPVALAEGEGPATEERVIFPADSPMNSGLQVRDLPLPGFPDGAGTFLRQVVDGTHPRIHEQFWALYAGGVRSDLWFFSPTPDRTDSKLLAPLAVEEILQPDPATLLLRVSGAMIRPMGAGWLQGVDLVFAVEPADGGAELKYRHNVRRYSFTYGYDRGEGRSSLVTTELARKEGDETVLDQRRYYDMPSSLSTLCGIDPYDDFPSGDFDELALIALCITAAPEAVVRRRTADEPTFIERGGVSSPKPEADDPPPAEGALEPPPGATELCSGHVSGAPLPDGRPGPHVTWTLFTSTETRHELARRYLTARGAEGHEAGADCDVWRRPSERPERILEICELGAEGPWQDCPAPPADAESRIHVSTLVRVSAK